MNEDPEERRQRLIRETRAELNHAKKVIAEAWNEQVRREVRSRVQRLRDALDKRRRREEAQGLLDRNKPLILSSNHPCRNPQRMKNLHDISLPYSHTGMSGISASP